MSEEREKREAELKEGKELFDRLVKKFEWDRESDIDIDIWSFHRYVKYVELLKNALTQPKLKLNLNPHSELIFRGCKDSSYQLMPSIMREDVFKDSPTKKQVEVYEERIMRKFKKRARPYVATLPRRERKEWEWLARAQHHFLPTRLLDWTERAGTALFFALEESDADESCVWAIAAPQEVRIVEGESDDKIEASEPKKVKEVLLYTPPHIVPRITVQQGCFTIHPSDYRKKFING